MILSAEEMTAKFFMLSEQQQQEVVDFIDFLSTRPLGKGLRQQGKVHESGNDLFELAGRIELDADYDYKAARELRHDYLVPDLIKNETLS